MRVDVTELQRDGFIEDAANMATLALLRQNHYISWEWTQMSFVAVTSVTIYRLAKFVIDAGLL